MDLPDELRAFAESHLGPIRAARFRGHPHAASAVWEIDAGVRVFLKHHRQVRKHRQEQHALRVWAAHLPVPAPRLLADDEAMRVLLLTAVPGEPVEEPERRPGLRRGVRSPPCTPSPTRTRTPSRSRPPSRRASTAGARAPGT